MKIRSDVELGQHSHVGMARTENQDFFGYWEPDDDREFDLRGRLAVVCDGMGGHSGGEIASRLAVKAIIENYQSSRHENVSEALRSSIEGANRAVYDEGIRLKELQGMGTTVTAIVQRRDMVYFGQVGDSRAYLIRGGQMKQMTKDHSLVQQLVDEGLLEESEMENHPDKNVILRSLGVKPEVEVDVSHIPIAPGDTFLLCSDGLSGLVTNEEILDTYKRGVASGKSLRQICEELIDQANAAGGHDNSTVQLLQVKDTTTSTTDETPPETVTMTFDENEVQASIERARAEAARVAAAAESGVGSVGADAPPKTPKAGALPATQPAMPVPKLSEPPGSGSGGRAGSLVLGLLVGVVLGGGLVFGFGQSSKSSHAAAAEKRAQSAVAKAKDGDVKKQAERLYEQGKKALSEGRYAEARAKFDAAASVAELVGAGE